MFYIYGDKYKKLEIIMKLLRELKIYRMEEIDDVSDTDDDYENDDFDLELDDEDADQFGDDSESFDDELEPAASGPDPDEQDMMGSEEDDEFADDSFDDEGEFSDDEFSDDEFSDDEFSDDEFSDDEFSDEEDQLGGEEPQDQNYQGNVRSIPGAFLVYKREAEDSTFEELWLYNVGKDIKHEMKLRRAILDGTDISPQTGKSKDNKQTAKITSLGNVQFLNVFGIPN
jgi:hypothetical protein